MTVSFNQIPNSNRVPGPLVEIDGSKALGIQAPEPHSVLFVGLRLTAGTALQGEFKSILGELDADPFFGSKSILAAATRAFKRVNRTAKVTAVAMDEAGGGVAAAGTFPLVGSASADGQITVRIGDQRITISVSNGTTPTAMGVALDAAIDATDRCSFTATNATGTVTVTHVHKGESGNHVTIAVEALPAGVTCTPVQPANGATNPSMATLIALLPDVRYDTIVTCMTDATSVLALENEMARRWGPLVKQPGMAVLGIRGSHGTLTGYGSARNSPYSCIMGSGLSPTPPWVWAAQAAAQNAIRCDTQPNRPSNGLVLPDCEAPALADGFDIPERNLLLFDGISTFKSDASGRVMIERLITTYQTNTSGLADAAYLSIEVLRNLAAIYMEALSIAGKYDTHLLVPDGTNVDQGVPIVTPKMFKGEMNAWYDSLIKRGRAKDAKGFAAALVSEINLLDGERLDTNVFPSLVRGLVTNALKISFQL